MNGLLALAFGAGLLAPINPCGFALLPAYLATQLGTGPGADMPASARLMHGLRSGTALAFGFALTLTTAGLAIALGARPLLGAAPWLAVIVGAVLAVIGVIMALTGHGPTVRIPGISGRTRTSPRTVPRTIVFGAGYALASLACTLGVLIAVIGQALATDSVASILTVFAAYAAGSATLLNGVSLTAAFASQALAPASRSLARYSGRIIGALLAITGIYLIAYWLPTATGSSNTGIGAPITALATTTQTWVTANQTLVIATTALAVAIALVLGVIARRRTPTPPTASEVEDCCHPRDLIPTPAHAGPADPAEEA